MMEGSEESPKKTKSVPTPIALDGGWGWIVVIGSFVAYFIADGWAYSFGVFYTELLDYFSESKGKTALVGGLLYGIPMLSSPVVCALTTVYGCRNVAIAGGLLMGFSFVFSIWATSVDYLCVTIGLLSSLGLAMTYIPAIFIVTFYFEKRRGLATGLAVTGSGIGAFAFPPFIEYLLGEYAWRGTSLILGGICFNIVVAAALFRPLAMTTVDDNTTDKETYRNAETGHLKLQSGNILMPRLHKKYRSNQIVRCKSMHGLGAQEHPHPSAALSLHNVLPPGGSAAELGEGQDHYEVCAMRNVVVLERYPDSKLVSCPDLYHYEPLQAESTAQVEPKRTRCLGFFWTELRNVVISMFDKSLPQNWAFLLFCAANFIHYLWAGTPYVYLVDKGRILGFGDSRSAFLLSIIGIARTLGQIVLGFLGDRERVSTIVLYAISVAISGLATLLVPLCINYGLLATYAAIYGLFFSVTYALQMMCLVDMVGVERVSSAFGLLQLIQGIATLLGTPITGWLYDAVGQYDISFYIAGAFILLAGLIILPLPTVLRCNQAKQEPLPEVIQA